MAELAADRRHTPATDPRGITGLGWPGPTQCGQMLTERAQRSHAGAVLFAAIDDFGRLEEVDGADPAAALTRRVMELTAGLPGRIGDVLAMAGDGLVAVLFENNVPLAARDIAERLLLSGTLSLAGAWPQAAGFRPDDDWLLLAQSFNAVSVGTPGAGYGHVRRYKLPLSAVRKLTDDVSVQFGLSKAMGGRNAGGERMVLLALWWNFGGR